MFKIHKPTRKGGERKRKYISITKNHAFGLPRTFIDAYITKENRVIILFDEERLQVALVFTDKDTPYSYSLRRSKNLKHGGWIVAKSFFEENKLNPQDNAGHYEYERVPLDTLGVRGHDGVGYLIKLKADNRPTVHEPINLFQEVDEQNETRS